MGGFALTRVLSEPVRRRLDARVAALWPPGPYALASAAAKVIGAMLGGSRRLVTCFVAPDDSAGTRARAARPAGAAWTVRESTEVVWPELSVRERVRLENAMML